jgi:hypothetical protein
MKFSGLPLPGNRTLVFHRAELRHPIDAIRRVLNPPEGAVGRRFTPLAVMEARSHTAPVRNAALPAAIPQATAPADLPVAAQSGGHVDTPAPAPTIVSTWPSVVEPPGRPRPQLTVLLPAPTTGGLLSPGTPSPGLRPPPSPASSVSSGRSGSGRSRRSASLLSVDLSNLSRPRSPVPTNLPPDLEGRRLGFAEELGRGKNGVVVALTVDGLPTQAYVAKKPLNFRVDDDNPDVFLDEIRFNQELAALARAGRLPNVVTGCGSGAIEGEPAMLMPRIDGGMLSRQIETLYDASARGRTSPDEFMRRFKALVRGPMEGIAALNDNGFVINDLNCGSLMFDRVGDRGVVIDFGLAGREGETKEPGTIGTVPPERLQFRDADRSDDAPGNRLSRKIDSYSFGAVLHALIHRVYPTWCNLPEGADDSQKMLELGLAIDEFRWRGSIYRGGSPSIGADLHIPANQANRLCEFELRSALRQSGFYELVSQLMHPHAGQRPTLREALDSRFMRG